MKKTDLMYTKMVQDSQNRPLELAYYLVSETGSGDITQYGVTIRASRAGARTDAQLCAITVSAERIEELLRLLANGSVTPVGLRDVVDDWL